MAEEFWYELMGFSRPMNDKEVSALSDLFEHQGWKVFMSMRQEEADASNAIGMSISEEEDTRAAHRALYHGFMNDLTFEDRFKTALNETKPVTLENLSIEM